MIRQSVIAGLFLVASASAQVSTELHLGARASSWDVSPEIGTGIQVGRVGLWSDFWIRPWYWASTRQEGSEHWVRHQELRFGFVPGIRIGIVDRDGLWLAPSCGAELNLGSWAGTARDPRFPILGWFGLEAGSSKDLLARVRWATGPGELSGIHVEVAAGWRFPWTAE